MKLNNQKINDDFDVSPLLIKKKSINKKKKGNAFENRIAKILNEKFDTKEFSRTPGSGAYATTHKLPEYLKIYGDLITPQGFKYLIETKKGYNKESIDSLFNPKSVLHSMIVQAIRDSKESSKDFFLVVGQDKRDIIVISNTMFKDYIERYLIIKVNSNWPTLYMFMLKDLLNVPNEQFWK